MKQPNNAALLTAQNRYDRARWELTNAAAELRLVKAGYERAERKKKREEIKEFHAIARKGRAKQRFSERRAKGLCRSCGKPAAPSKHKNSMGGRLRFCEAHHAVQLAGERKRKGVANPRKALTKCLQE